MDGIEALSCSSTGPHAATVTGIDETILHFYPSNVPWNLVMKTLFRFASSCAVIVSVIAVASVLLTTSMQAQWLQFRGSDGHRHLDQQGIAADVEREGTRGVEDRDPWTGVVIAGDSR